MSISRLIKVLIIVFTISASLNVAFALLADQARDRQVDALQQRIQLTYALHDMQSVSIDLTRLARSYVVTGDIQYYNEFINEIENVRRRENAVLVFESLGVPQNELDLIRHAMELDSTLADLDDLAFDAVKSGDFDLATQIIYGVEYEEARRPIIETLDQLGHIVRDRTQGEMDAAYASASFFSAFSLVITVIYAILSIIGIALILRKISPIRKLMSLLNDVANGNMNVNIDRTGISKDEIGMLTKDIYGLVDVIKSIVKDLSIVHKEYIEVGNMHYTIDNKQYNHSFKEMIDWINNLCACVTQNIESVADSLIHVSDGDFSRNLNEGAWVGEWGIVPKAFNKLTSNLNAVETEIEAMIEAATVKGDLRFHIDSDKYSGRWQGIMNGLNNIAEAVNKPVVEIRNAMKALAQGQFSSVSISSNYRGDFLSMSESVNMMIETINSYMGEIAEVLRDMSEGDLTKSIQREFIGEFDSLKKPINKLFETLHKTISEISEASGQVLIGASQISSSAINLSNGAQEQASALEELNTTIDIINQQTQQNASNALMANEFSNNSTAKAQDGNKSMSQMVSAMDQIKKSSNDISKIVKTIQDIAFQTNLLALNASVEAARAAEHGKGFAVVADEVRSLASRSQIAATETAELIQGSINSVESGSGIATAAAESLDAIVTSSNEVLEIIRNISASSTEQAESIAHISEGLAQISMVTQSNSASSVESAAASEELSSQAEMLKKLVAYFNL